MSNNEKPRIVDIVLDDCERNGGFDTSRPAEELPLMLQYYSEMRATQIIEVLDYVFRTDMQARARAVRLHYLQIAPEFADVTPSAPRTN